MAQGTREGCAKIVSTNKRSKGKTTFKTSMKLEVVFPDTSYQIINSISGLVDIDSTVTYFVRCSTIDPKACNVDYKTQVLCE
jgi:hypothetical protein